MRSWSGGGMPAAALDSPFASVAFGSFVQAFSAAMTGVTAADTSPETHPAHFFLPVRDRDASVELVLPAASTEAAEADSAKRQRCEPAAAAAAVAPPAADGPQAAAIGLAEHTIILPSSTHLLKSASPKFW